LIKIDFSPLFNLRVAESMPKWEGVFQAICDSFVGEKDIPQSTANKKKQILESKNLFYRKTRLIVLR